MLVKVSVIGAAVLLALGVLLMVISAITSTIQGKQDVKKVSIMAIPFVAFGICYLVFNDTVEAAVMALGIMIGAMVLSVALSGLRETLKF